MATQQASAAEPAPRQQSNPRRISPASATTEERDDVYGLVSVLHHALQGAETYAQYAQHARQSGDCEVFEFFEEFQAEEVDRAHRVKELLADRLDRNQSNGTGNGEGEEGKLSG